ncbi:MAG: type II glyceraldehyde-3-phosphate dehydrogenase [Thermoplasmata archaeon]|nr:type II glyceraldehyde-3-phosphate dehydrogenase [Thermoplasmata archaeon]
MVVKVAINGYGTIGKRVADAVSWQDDMKIIGVVKTRPTYECITAMQKGFKIYAASDDKVQAFKDAGFDVAGTAKELFEEADIIVDCTPGKKKEGGTTGEDYKKVYEELGKPAIFQGGEKHKLTGLSFNAFANYEKCIGAKYVRVVSCNTTGLLRTLVPVHREIGIENVKVVLVRRATDPNDSKKGPLNAIQPEIKVPSHHGPDVQSVVPDINISSMAVVVPTTIMHLHNVMVTLKKEVKTEDVINIWKNTTRVILVNSKHGFESTAQLMEYAKDLGRPRGDLYEIPVWKDGVSVVGRELYYTQAVHQESDVVPENIDAIRAMMNLESDKLKSIEKTNRTLKIIK